MCNCYSFVNLQKDRLIQQIFLICCNPINNYKKVRIKFPPRVPMLANIDTIKHYIIYKMCIIKYKYIQYYLHTMNKKQIVIGTTTGNNYLIRNYVTVLF